MTGPDQLEGQLAAALSATLGEVEIRSLQRLTGGASRETWSFDAVDAGGGVHELVLRRDPPARPGPRGSMSLEASVIRLAGAAGVPVPEVLVDTDDPEVWGAAGMVMRRVDGEALGKRILRSDLLVDARARFVRQCGAALAALHSVDPDALQGAPEFDPLDAMRALLDDLGEPVPTFEYALRWLDEHRPAGSGRAIVHGDFRLGNLLVAPAGVTAVLDWELVHIGDPLEDLGWLCVRSWRFGAELPVAGMGTREELLDAYVAAGGPPATPEALRWWEAYGTLRWGIICLTQTAVHLRGDLRSVELAAIGRRVAETEWDLLLLLAPDAAAVAADLAPQPAATVQDEALQAPGLHGRPTAAELVEAVQEFLTGQVVGQTEGALSYHARVAANVLATVGRELAAGEVPLQRRALALARLGVRDERELCTAIRVGDLDDRDRAVRDVLAEGVVDRVSVANPSHLR